MTRSARTITWSALLICVAARTLGAQDAGGTPPGVVAPSASVDSVGLFERPNGSQMRTGAITYRLSLARPDGPSSLGTRTVEVSQSSVGGVDAWLIAEQRTGSAVSTADSLWLTRTDLMPLRWVGAIDRTQLAVSFAHDSVFGAMQSYAGRSSFAAPVLPGVLVTSGMAERIVELLPLHVGYRAGASLLLVDMGVPRALPAEIVVEREEQIRTATGDADCWVVLLRAGAMEERLWIDRGRRTVVRIEQGKLVSEIG